MRTTRPGVGPGERRTRRLAVIGLAATMTMTAAPALGFQTQVQDFVIEPPSVANSPYSYDGVLSVKDRVPRTSKRSQTYQMPTIPDGLGALPRLKGKDANKGKMRSGYSRGQGDGFLAGGSDFSVFMNAEINKDEDQELILSQPDYQGAIISLLQMRNKGRKGVDVRSGDLAYDVVVDTADGDRRHQPSTEANDPGADDAFGRFCSGFLAYDYQDYGFDRPIYFTGEEASTSFDDRQYYEGKGGVATATFEHNGVKELHTMPDAGYFAWENVVPVPGYKGKTVIMGLEDGPSGYRSQMYMYVADQQKNSKDPMKRNGLVDGELYVMQVDGRGSEVDFEQGERNATWIKVPDAAKANETALEDFAQSVNAFDTFRIEDGDSADKQLIFDTTGGDRAASFEQTLAADNPGNYYGRLYGLYLATSNDPTGQASVSIEYDADEAVAQAVEPNYSGGRANVSLDNLTLSPNGYLLTQEDATGYGDDFMVEQGRDAQVWRFRTRVDGQGRLRVRLDGALPVAEVSCIYDGGRDDDCGGFDVGGGEPPSGAQGNGTWETSGIIDADHVLGPDTFLLDVQAHSEDPPLPCDESTSDDYGRCSEDGQLGVLKPKSRA